MKMSEDPTLWPENEKKKIFIICPVRPLHVKFLKRIYAVTLKLLFGIEDEWTKIQKAIRACVEKLEKERHEVYWPKRDNPYQNTDKVGIQIITFNRDKMLWADKILIWYDKNSTGSIFDFGMLFMTLELFDEKEIGVINPQDIESTLEKSFENVILALVRQYGNEIDQALALAGRFDLKVDQSGDTY